VFLLFNVPLLRKKSQKVNLSKKLPLSVRKWKDDSYRVLEPEDIVQSLQKGCTEGDGIFYAYFGREREYTFHFAKSLNDVIENIPYITELTIDDVYKDTTEYSGRIDFRSDEWIVFPNEGIVDKFCAEIIRRSPPSNEGEDE